MGTDQDASFRWALAGYGAGGRTFHRPLISSATGLELVAVVTGSPERQAQVRAELPGATPVGELADLAGTGRPGRDDHHTHRHPRRAGARGAGAGPARGGRQTVRADRGGRPRARRPCGRRRPGHHPVPEPAVGQRPADPAPADRRRRARRGAPVHLPDRPVPTGQGQLARRNRRGGRRHPARPRSAPGRPGAAPVRSGHRGARRTPDDPGRRRRRGRDRAAPDPRRWSAVDAGRRHGVGRSRAPVPGERPARRVRHRRLRRAGGAAQGRRVAGVPGRGWGVEPESAWGLLYTESGAERVPSERGRWDTYYPAVARAMAGDGPPPVDPKDAVATATVLDAARESAAADAVVLLS